MYRREESLDHAVFGMKENSFVKSTCVIDHFVISTADLARKKVFT